MARPLSIPIGQYLSALSLEEFVDGYDAIELKIQTAAFEAGANRVLERRLASGDRIEVPGLDAVVHSQVLRHQREMDITFVPLMPGPPRRSRTVSVNACGVIQKVRAHAPVAHMALAEQMAEAVADELDRLYAILERAFLAAYRVVQNQVFDRLNVPLQAALERASLLRIAMRCHLSVTPLRDGKYSLLMSYESVRGVLGVVRRERSSPFSAIEAAIILVNSRGLDAFIKYGAVSQAKFATMNFDDIIRLENHSELARVESLIYADQALACIELARSQGLSLQLNVPAEFMEAMLQVVDEARPQILQQFQFNAARLGDVKARLSHSWTTARSHRSATLDALSEFSTSLLAKLGAELVKP